MAGEDVTDAPGMVALLERHRPLLKFDAQEPYLAIAAESITRSPGSRLMLADGTRLGEVDEHGAGLELGLLSAYPAGRTPSGDDRLDEVHTRDEDLIAAARRLQAMPELTERAYGRAVRDGEWLWLQYWFWEYYNPKNLLGFGRHEGDWELVQLGLDADQVPRVVTYAQHNGGAPRAWEEIEHHPDEGGEHPVVYVAPFSHASYFSARTYWHPGGPETPDGRGPSYLPRIERFGPWGTWPGRWGNSDGVLAWISGGKLGGRSPPGPGAQKGRWERPTEFHEQAVRKRPLGAVDRRLWSLGRRTYPNRPRLEGLALRGASLSGEYAVERSPARRASRIYLTVHDADRENEPVLVSTALRVAGERGSFELAMPREPERLLVRASAFNGLRQRSDPTDVAVERSG